MLVGTRHRLNAEIARQSRLAEEVARAQIEISGKVRILSASDDPAAAARVGQIKQAQGNEATWLANANVAATFAERADSALESLTNAATRALELISLGKNGTSSPGDREAYAAELDGIAATIRTLQDQIDSRGQRVFPTDPPLAIPIGQGLTLSATIPNDIVFGTGTNDFATVIDAAAAALREADPVAREAATTAAFNAITASSNRVIDARSYLGARMALIDNVRENLTESRLTLENERSDLEDTDIAEAVARLEARMLSLNASQAAFVRINRQTLFDLLG